MTLHVEDLEIGASGGRIWLDFGGRCFPEEGWYELPGVLLEYWIPALESFAAGHTDFCKLGFLDGPYALWLTRKRDAVWVSCMEQGKCMREEKIDFSDFWNSVQHCVCTYKKYLKNC